MEKQLGVEINIKVSHILLPYLSAPAFPPAFFFSFTKSPGVGILMVSTPLAGPPPGALAVLGGPTLVDRGVWSLTPFSPLRQ